MHLSCAAFWDKPAKLQLEKQDQTLLLAGICEGFLEQEQTRKGVEKLDVCKQ